MSLSPSDILQRLKQLKVWQESQEELLKKTKNIIDTSTNLSTASDYQTIEGLSAFDSSINNENSPKKNWENQVISPTKSFNELLEEKLAQDPGPKNVIQKPKKPFLRKGAGLERFKLKTQPSRKPPKRSKINKNQNKSDSDVTPLRAPDLSIKPKATWSKIDDSLEQVRRINQQLEKNSAVGDQTLYEKQLEKELLIFEALEQRAENSSFCSTNSSVLRILSSTPSKKQRTVTEEKHVHWESHSEDEDIIETNLERKDIAEILLRLKTMTENRKPDLPSIIHASADEKWSSTEPSSETSSVTSVDLLESTLKTERRNIGVGTEYSLEICAICGDILQKKLTECENQIKEVLRDKNRISELTRQLEQKEIEFLKKKKEFENEKEDILFELETERKKLAKEKLTFQMYMKDLQNRPNKKERQEISNLKQEVADLSETLKLKESKNGMTQARLRNQIKQLEKENANLRDEVEKLTKENARRSANQKLQRKSSDTKILQEINKNITKLAQETLKNGKKPDEENQNLAKVEARNDKSLTKRKSSLLDIEDSFLEMENHDFLEKQYENTFRNQSFNDELKASGTCLTTGVHQSDSNRLERHLEDGSKQIKYKNGNIKTVSPDGNLISIQYFNGDKQETNLLDGTVKYYFSQKNICQTTYADGLEVVEFPEGIIEKRYSDGKCEITLPDGVIQITSTDGFQETRYTDGSIVKINKNGDKILLLPNGQKEIETREFKKREYPDGTVKILYPDGTQETKYANGRIRIKDKNGTLLVDSQS